MKYTLEATFDGAVLRLDEELPLEPGARVQLTIETKETQDKKAYAWLHTAQALKLDGPADASVRYERDLYGRDIDER